VSFPLRPGRFIPLLDVVWFLLKRLAAGELRLMMLEKNLSLTKVHAGDFWVDFKMHFSALSESLTLNFSSMPMTSSLAECLFSLSSRQCHFANMTETEMAYNFSYASNVRGQIARTLKSSRRLAGIETAKKPFRNAKDRNAYVSTVRILHCKINLLKEEGRSALSS
jgi:hypothetical protein